VTQLVLAAVAVALVVLAAMQVVVGRPVLLVMAA
jgi:hypothetical protein